MYLFIYGEYEGIPEYAIISSFDMDTALADFYEYVGGHHGIDKTMFGKMVRKLSLNESVELFNALCEANQIHEIYTGLSIAYKKEDVARDA